MAAIPNQIQRFAKMNHQYFCVSAFEAHDIRGFCRHFLCLALSRNGSVEFPEPITVVIARLTSWKIDSIRKALNRLVSDGECTWQKDSDRVMIMNDMVINRQGMVLSDNLEYDGLDPHFTKRQAELFSDLNSLIKANEEKLMSVINENDRLKNEVFELRLKIAELEGHQRGYEQGIDKGIDKTIDKCFKQFVPTKPEIKTDAAPVISIVKRGNDIRVEKQ